jgi:hypothetical protein
MAKCLRCGAESEWIQGRVPDEQAASVEAHEHYQPQIDELIAENNALRAELAKWAGTAHAAAFASDRGTEHGT